MLIKLPPLSPADQLLPQTPHVFLLAELDPDDPPDVAPDNRYPNTSMMMATIITPVFDCCLGLFLVVSDSV